MGTGVIVMNYRLLQFSSLASTRVGGTSSQVGSTALCVGAWNLGRRFLLAQAPEQVAFDFLKSLNLAEEYFMVFPSLKNKSELAEQQVGATD